MSGFQNPGDVELSRLLESRPCLTVVGLSAKPARPSHGVSRAMQGFGFRIRPVNPGQSELLGEPCVGQLRDVEPPPELVNVFRSPRHVAALVDECIHLKVPALWLQEGVVDEQAAMRAVEAGIVTVMDRCIYKEYLRLGIDRT